MRKGYWKTLLRRLRSRVASGSDTFTTVRHQTLTIVEVLASSDDALDPPAELALAATAEGATFQIDIGNNLVMLRADAACASVSTALDLPSFIEALHAGNGYASRIAVDGDDIDFPDWRLPRRPLLDD
jgi:hypothetical protein